MLDLHILDRDNIEFFQPIITRNAQSFINCCYEGGFEDSLIMLGVTDDSNPVGAIVTSMKSDYSAVIESLFVRTDFRRMGIGSNLVAMTCELLSQQEVYYTLKCTVTERWEFDKDSALPKAVPARGSDLRAFFTYLGFSESLMENVGAYQMRFGDSAARIVPPVSDKFSFKRISELSLSEKNSLMDEDEGLLYYYLNEGMLDEELSRFYVKNGVVKGCFVVERDDKQLVITWARVDEDAQLSLVHMVRDSFLRAREIVDDSAIVFLPYINEVSKTAIEKICNDKIVNAEVNYEFTYDLGALMDGENLEI